MRLDALKHLCRAVQVMCESERIVVFGSASILVSHPELGETAESPLLLTFDADLIPFPFDEEVGTMLDEAFGEDRAFHKKFGYHADIVRPKVTETFPHGWETRMRELLDVSGVFCLDPHDMAAAKCLVGRKKDEEQISYLLGTGLLCRETLEQRITKLELDAIHVGKAMGFLKQLDEHRGDAVDE